jgi:hypothetical protein
MTRVRIAPPDTEEDVSAEQVAAYLLAPERGWTHEPDTSEHWHTFTRGLGCANVPRSAMVKDRRRLTECIHDIARAEQRHPSAVLADIVGPARGEVGAVCAVGMDGPWLWGGCRRADSQCRDSAARGAGESEEPSR